ncbi:MAG: peptidoglycan-binding protein [Bacteroidales bacterium]|nr:peptidoglycan-binding protein [Bacteroidales bacterium]
MADNDKPRQDGNHPEPSAVPKRSLKSLVKQAHPEPEPTAVIPEPTAIKPERTAVQSEKTAVKPERTAVKPEKTAVPEGVASTQGFASSQSMYQAGDGVSVGGHNLDIVRCLGSGTEGEIYVVKEGKKTLALKACHRGFKTNTKVLSALQPLKGKGYIVDIEEFGDTFELMEYIEGKSAADVNFNFPADPKHEKKAQAILAIVCNIAMCLDKMHESNVLHKDVKPANILIKDTETWDSVLCDFGIADLMKTETKDGVVRKYCVTRRNRTPIYAAPEIYREDNAIVNDGKSISSEMTPKADFYSLGMTILSLWLGEEAMNRNEQENALKKIRGHVAVPDDMPDPLNRITRGLLIKEPTKRWDFKSIDAFMHGEDVPVEEDEIMADLNIVYNAAKHQIAHDLKDLALFMDEDPQLAEGYLYRGRLNKWLSDYPEIQNRLDDIVENRYRKDHQGGVVAAIYALSPDMPFKLEGIDKKTGGKVSCSTYTLKEVSDFYNRAVASYDTNKSVESQKFAEWVRQRDPKLADALPNEHMLRIQTIDPLSDINLCNDLTDPHYAMTAERIGKVLNDVYNICWNKCKGNIWDFDSGMQTQESRYGYLNGNAIGYITFDFQTKESSSYIIDFMKTKGGRFNKQIDWIDYCLDYESDDNQEKAGPKDEEYLQQVAWMKVIKGFGIDPVYHLEDEDTDVTTVSELFRFPKRVLRKEYEERGLRGWLAVQHHENPDADLKPQFTYEKLLQEYLEDVARIDPDEPAVKRFEEAADEAKRLIREGKGKIGKQSWRNATQYLLSLLLGVLPLTALAIVLVVNIIMHPTVDTSGMGLENWVWPIGLLAGAILYFVLDTDGCLIPIIIGVVGAAVLFFLVKFLGQFILYFYLIVVLAALITFTIMTIFNKSDYAKKARKFDKPGFEEYVLEPLYYAYSDEDEFDSSLNGMVDDAYIEKWGEDLKGRRYYVLIFIASSLLLWSFSMLFLRGGTETQNPFVQKIAHTLGWDKVEEEAADDSIAMPVLTGNLQKGSKGEAVTAMQKRLKQLGFYDEEITDNFDESTRKAVKAFQKANKLKVDGVVGEKTMEKMFSPEAIGATAPVTK